MVRAINLVTKHSAALENAVASVIEEALREERAALVEEIARRYPEATEIVALIQDRN